MELLQVREKEIFEALKALKGSKFTIIGGYAVNAYALPRFSVDCDIVVEEEQELEEIKKRLEERGYERKEANKISTPYHGSFERYEKTILKDFSVSMDILMKDILDRQTKATFSASWVFKHSKEILLRGKTITEKIISRVITADALFAMKAISCRASDIRDIFMLAPLIKDKEFVREEISKRTPIEERSEKIISSISSKQFRDGLQGVFGLIDETAYNKHKNAIRDILETKE